MKSKKNTPAKIDYWEIQYYKAKCEQIEEGMRLWKQITDLQKELSILKAQNLMYKETISIWKGSAISENTNECSKIEVEGLNDIEIGYEEMVRLAFEEGVSDDLQKHYQEILINAAKFEREKDCGWHRLLFLQNPETKRVRLWFD